MKKIILSTFTIIGLLLTSCGGDAEATNSESDASNETIENSENETSSNNFDSPCQFISEADIKSRFNIEESLAVKMEDKVLTFPTCSFKWKDGKVKKQMKIATQEIEVDMDSEVMIVMVKSANDSKFKAATNVYPDGQEETIGEKSMWSDKRSQLTFMSDGYMFHVHVMASNDNSENKSNAKGIAGDILSQL